MIISKLLLLINIKIITIKIHIILIFSYILLITNMNSKIKIIYSYDKISVVARKKIAKKVLTYGERILSLELVVTADH